MGRRQRVKKRYVVRGCSDNIEGKIMILAKIFTGEIGVMVRKNRRDCGE